MSSPFPNSYDNLTTSRTVGGPDPAPDMNAADSAINATQQRVGINGSGNAASFDNRVAALETEVAQIANGGSVGTNPSHPSNYWGFEDGTVQGWVAGTATSIAVDNTISHSGTDSLKVTQSSSTQASATVTVTVSSGQNWLNRIFVRGDGTSAGKFVEATATDVSGSFTQVSVPVKLTTGWQEIWAMVPTTGTSLIVGITGVDLTSGMNVWIDDISVSTVAVPAMTTNFQTVLKNTVPTHWTGVGYYPTPIGLNNTNSSVWGEPKQARYDMQDIASASMNSIRVYWSASAYNRSQLGALLDECLRNGIDVWMGLFVPTGTDYSVSTGSANRTAQQAVFTDMVTKCKYHPAIVGYLFGNEMNYNYGPNTNDSVWYPYLNTVLAAGKAIDSNRLMSTANGQIAAVQTFDSVMTSMDVWGANMYQNTAMAGVEDKLYLWTTKPFIFTEYGNDRYDTTVGAENPVGQSRMVVSLMRDIDTMTNVSGSYLFEWNDEYWKGGNDSTQLPGGFTPDNNDPFDNYSNEAYYGITHASAQGNAAPRTKAQAYSDIVAYRQQVVQSGSANQVNNLSADGSGRLDGEIYRDSAGNRYRATVNPRYLSATWNTSPIHFTPWYPFQPESATSPILLMDGTTMTNSGGLISGWTDSSGVLAGELQNHPTFIQFNSSNQPTFLSASLNGLNVLRIPGTGQFMEMNNFPFGQNVTVFFVVANQRVTLGSNQVDVIMSSRPSGSFQSGLSLASYNSFATTSNRRFSADTTGGSGTPVCYVNGASATGVNLTQGTFYVLACSVTDLPPFSYIRLGQYTEFNTPFNGVNDIAEIRVYQGAMNSTQVGTVTTALRSKYAI